MPRVGGTSSFSRRINALGIFRNRRSTPQRRLHTSPHGFARTQRSQIQLPQKLQRRVASREGWTLQCWGFDFVITIGGEIPPWGLVSKIRRLHSSQIARLNVAASLSFDTPGGWASSFPIIPDPENLCRPPSRTQGWHAIVLPSLGSVESRAGVTPGSPREGGLA